MSERDVIPVDENDMPIQDPEDGILPGVDLQLGDDPAISGGDDLAEIDEENLYGNDVIVDPDGEFDDEEG
jgi:hypothetical protein